MLANLGYECFMYDMTIDDLPYHRSEFHFFKEGIGNKFDPVEKLDTLEHFINRNGHENQRHMILKMDVEGAEWNFLEQVSDETLNQFDQIVFEFHEMSYSSNYEKQCRTITMLKKINRTHQVVHMHANNAGVSLLYDGEEYPDVLEVTYANRSNYEFYDDEIILPVAKLDSPNAASIPEVVLGNWNNRWR